MQLDLSRFSPAERSTLQLRVLYEGAGFRKIRCSHFEEYSLYQQNERFLSDSQVITFTDLDGKLRAIKPDVTLSIAKNAQPAAGMQKVLLYRADLPPIRPRSCALRWKAWPAGKFPPCWKSAIWAL